MSLARAVVVAALALLVTAVAQAAPNIERIIVMPFITAGGVDEKKAALLNELFMSDLTRVVPKETTLVGASDVTAMLGAAEQRRLMSCDDTSCLAEIGSAMGASHMISSSLGMVGTRYLVSTKLVDTQKAKVLYRNSIYLGSSEEELVDGLHKLATDMAQQMGWITAAPIALAAANSAPAAAQPEGSGVSPLLLMGGGVAALGALGAMGSAIGVAVLDGQAGDTGRSWSDRQQAAQLNLGVMGGTVVGIVLLLVGGGLATWALVGGAA